MEPKGENRKEINRIKKKRIRIIEKSVDDYTIHVKGGISLIKKCEELFGCNLFTAELKELGALGSEFYPSSLLLTPLPLLTLTTFYSYCVLAICSFCVLSDSPFFSPTPALSRFTL
jgi:hypothetical protein